MRVGVRLGVRARAGLFARVCVWGGGVYAYHMCVWCGAVCVCGGARYGVLVAWHCLSDCCVCVRVLCARAMCVARVPCVWFVSVCVCMCVWRVHV